MGFASEFKAFAIKGNVVDLAVGVIIGAAFGKIVDSVVKDLIMPLVNLVGGGQIDFSNKYLVLSGQVPAGAALATVGVAAGLCRRRLWPDRLACVGVPAPWTRGRTRRPGSSGERHC